MDVRDNILMNNPSTSDSPVVGNGGDLPDDAWKEVETRFQSLYQHPQYQSLWRTLYQNSRSPSTTTTAALSPPPPTTSMTDDLRPACTCCDAMSSCSSFRPNRRRNFVPDHLLRISTADILDRATQEASATLEDFLQVSPRVVESSPLSPRSTAASTSSSSPVLVGITQVISNDTDTSAFASIVSDVAHYLQEEITISGNQPSQQAPMSAFTRSASQPEVIDLCSDSTATSNDYNDCHFTGEMVAPNNNSFGDDVSLLDESSDEAEWDDDTLPDDSRNATDIGDLVRRTQNILIVDSDESDLYDNIDMDDDCTFSDGDSLDSAKIYRRRRHCEKQAQPVTQASFLRNRKDMTQNLFIEFDRVVFRGKLSATTTVGWTNKLRTTAGITRLIKRPIRSAAIELSTKVVDSVSRLRETLMHELCHAAVWLLDEDRTAHGTNFKKWANRAMNLYQDISVTTRHDYEISYKFQWKCTQCHGIIGRQSKNSVDIHRHVCGKCQGRLEVWNGPASMDKAPRVQSAYNRFVKENASRIRHQLEHENGGRSTVSQVAVIRECARLWKQRNPSE